MEISTFLFLLNVYIQFTVLFIVVKGQYKEFVIVNQKSSGNVLKLQVPMRGESTTLNLKKSHIHANPTLTFIDNYKLKIPRIENIEFFKDVENSASLSRTNNKYDTLFWKEFEGSFIYKMQRYNIRPVLPTDAPPNNLTSLLDRLNNRKKRRRRSTKSVDITIMHLVSQPLQVARTPGSNVPNPFNPDSVVTSNLEFPSRIVGDFPEFRVLASSVQENNQRMYEDYNVELMLLLDHTVWDAAVERSNKDESRAASNLKYEYAQMVNTIDTIYSTISPSNNSFAVSFWLAEIRVARRLTDLVDTIYQSDNFISLNFKDRKTQINGQKVLTGLQSYRLANGLTHLYPDHLQLITRYDIVSTQSGTFKPTVIGIANNRGICTSLLSNTVIEELGVYTWFVSAHELGHSLGAVHDGLDNSCSADDKFLMTPLVGSELDVSQLANAFTLSSCTISEIKRLIKGTTDGYPRTCLTNRPCHHGQDIPDINGEPPLGVKYDLDLQCRISVDINSRICAPKETDINVCQVLRCYKQASDLCVAFSPGAFAGTQCGDQSWCSLGKCVDRNIPLNGDGVKSCTILKLPTNVPEGCVDDPTFSKTVKVNNRIIGPFNCKAMVETFPEFCFRFRIVQVSCCESCHKNGLVNPVHHLLPIDTDMNTTTVVKTQPTTTSENCKDLRVDCDYFKENGFCESNSILMADVCKKTCQLCHTTTEITQSKDQSSTNFSPTTPLSSSKVTTMTLSSIQTTSPKPTIQTTESSSPSPITNSPSVKTNIITTVEQDSTITSRLMSTTESTTPHVATNTITTSTESKSTPIETVPSSSSISSTRFVVKNTTDSGIICDDVRSDCAFFENRGDCKNNIDLMRKYCLKTCKFCIPIITTTGITESVTPDTTKPIINTSKATSSTTSFTTPTISTSTIRTSTPSISTSTISATTPTISSTLKTTTTTSYSDSCSDLYSTVNCISYKQGGYCYTSKEYMKEICAKTCQLCGTTAPTTPQSTTCYDLRDDCQYFKSIGYCEARRDIMITVCASTCNLCDSGPNPCVENNPCRNNGECLRSGDSFTCKCKAGFTGDLCNLVDSCFKNPCNEGSTCINIANTYKCMCAEDYTGSNCKTKIQHECFSKCINGDCVKKNNSVSDYKCNCNLNFIGEYCQYNDPCLSQPCQNSATCHPISELAYECICMENYSGRLCDAVLDPCLQSPCKNSGKCQQVDNSALTVCICQPNFEGVYCDIPITNLCRINPCLNGGTCQNEKNAKDYSCLCDSNYEGVNCEKKKLACWSNPCRNNGLCNVVGDGFKCECRLGFEGINCQNVTKFVCDDKPCKNNGRCLAIGNNFTCECVNGFTGKFCEIENDPCHSSPCQNNGTCHSNLVSNLFNCVCMLGYNGDFCENVITTNSQSTSNINLNTGFDLTTDIEETQSIIISSTNFIKEETTTDDLNTEKTELTTSVNNRITSDSSSSGSSSNSYSSNFIDDTTTGSSNSITDYSTNRNDDITVESSQFTTAQTNLFTNQIEFQTNFVTGEIEETTTIKYPTTQSSTIQSTTKQLCQDTRSDCAFYKVVGFCKAEGYRIYMVQFCAKTCEACTEVDACTSLPCKNGGSCLVKSDGKFQCKCPPEYGGDTCTQWAQCVSNPCLNGGICSINNVNGYVCSCKQGYVGINCERKVCIPNPCLNSGICRLIDPPPSKKLEPQFVCHCPPKYAGSLCQVTDCPTCHNGGKCQVDDSTTSSNKKPYCACTDRYKGENCQLDTTFCSNEPCGVNGMCELVIGGYKCVCKNDWTGNNCQSKIERSTIKPADCVDLWGASMCKFYRDTPNYGFCNFDDPRIKSRPEIIRSMIEHCPSTCGLC